MYRHNKKIKTNELFISAFARCLFNQNKLLCTDSYFFGQNRIKYQIDNIGTISGETEMYRSNAPVTHVLWQCENLPLGLTLSQGGEISGRPTTTGSYACTVTVTTN